MEGFAKLGGFLLGVVFVIFLVVYAVTSLIGGGIGVVVGGFDNLIHHGTIVP
jgi:hypothetical protein